MRALGDKRGSSGQAAAIALTLAESRLLWRAALFLWNMPLSATESMTLWASLNRSAALGLSPATTAFWTFLITVRNFERRAELAALSLMSWRARLRPEAIRTVFLALEEVAICSDLEFKTTSDCNQKRGRRAGFL